MSQVIVVGYDGSNSADRALDFALALAKAQHGSVQLIHVLEWSPYSFLTPTELEERHGRRKEELDRAQAAIVDPVVARVAGGDVEISARVKYGHIADVLAATAKDVGANQIVIGRTGHSGLASRVFGSVAGSLAQHSTVPVTIVP